MRTKRYRGGHGTPPIPQVIGSASSTPVPPAKSWFSGITSLFSTGTGTGTKQAGGRRRRHRRTRRSKRRH